MLKRLLLPTISALLLLSLVTGALPGPVLGGSDPPAAPNPEAGSAPSLLFIENAGQFASGARFYVPSGLDAGPLGAEFWLAGDALWLSLSEPAPALAAR